MDKIKRIRYEISGILAVVSGLIVFISLVTHYQWDPSPATTATDARNLLGIFGSYVSDILLQAVGFTAYIFPILLCIFGIRKILGKQGRHKPAAAVAVLLILVISVSSLFTLVIKDQTRSVPAPCGCSRSQAGWRGAASGARRHTADPEAPRSGVPSRPPSRRATRSLAELAGLLFLRPLVVS